MKRDDVMALVIKNVKKTVPDLEDADIDPDKPYRELDLTSIDVAEIVSRTIRELKVEVPRSQLAKLTSVTQFVDLVCGAAGIPA